MIVIFLGFCLNVSFAGYNYDPLIATAPSEVHPVGTDVTMYGTAIGGSGNYSFKWYKVNEDGSETLVATSNIYHIGVINEAITDKYRFEVTDTVQQISVNDLSLAVVFEKLRTIHFDEGSGDEENWGT